MRRIEQTRNSRLPDDDGVAVYLSRAELNLLTVMDSYHLDEHVRRDIYNLINSFRRLKKQEQKNVEKSDIPEPFDYDLRSKTSGSPAVPTSTDEESSRPAADSPATDSSSPADPDFVPGRTA